MKTNPMALATAILLGILTLTSSCANAPIQPENRPLASPALNPPVAETSSDSSIEIIYVLGHSHRRFLAEKQKDKVSGQIFLDHQLLHESGIDHPRYFEFLSRVEHFVNTPQRHPADQLANEPCRTPFTVTLKIDKDKKTTQGCRGADDGVLSHLVRDGEFLLYSNK